METTIEEEKVQVEEPHLDVSDEVAEEEKQQNAKIEEPEDKPYEDNNQDPRTESADSTEDEDEDDILARRTKGPNDGECILRNF